MFHMAVSNQVKVARGTEMTAPILPKWRLMKPCQLPHNTTAPVLAKQLLLLGRPVERGWGCREKSHGTNQQTPKSVFKQQGRKSGMGFPQETVHGMTTRRENIATKTKL